MQVLVYFFDFVSVKDFQKVLLVCHIVMFASFVCIPQNIIVRLPIPRLSNVKDKEKNSNYPGTIINFLERD